MSRATFFWNLFAKRYSKSKISDMNGYEKTLSDTQKYFRKDMHVLELGCGTGMTALKHAPFVKHYTATDISKNMVGIGKERASKGNVSNVAFLEATVFDDQLKENSYDAVLALNLIHLVKDRDAAFKRVHELLKPGGFFISKTPCLGGSIFMFFMALFFRFIIGPIGRFTADEYKESMKNAGFEIVEEFEFKEEHPRLFVVGKKK